MDEIEVTLIRPSEGRPALDRAHVLFELPDGQQVEFMVNLTKPGDHQHKRWEVSVWTHELRPRLAANFEFPLDTSVYPA